MEDLKERESNMLEKLLDSLDSLVWYNGYYELLIKMKEEILIADEESIYKFDYGEDNQFQVIWMILVCMYGGYGTSPRYGWLELKNKDEIIEFIDLITKTAREEK